MHADFLSVQDTASTSTCPPSADRRAQAAVLYHLNNDPDDKASGGCRFIKKFGTAGAGALIRRRAAQQKRYGFRVSYPVLFPECFHGRPNEPGHFLSSYNAFRDPPVARAIAELLDRYQFGSARRGAAQGGAHAAARTSPSDARR